MDFDDGVGGLVIGVHFDDGVGGLVIGVYFDDGVGGLVIGVYFDDGVGGLVIGVYFDYGVGGLVMMGLCLIIGCLLLYMKLVSLLLLIGGLLKDNCNCVPVLLERAFNAANAPFFLLGSFISGVIGLSSSKMDCQSLCIVCMLLM